MNVPNSCGELPTGSAPSLDNLSLVSGCLRIAATSAPSLLTISGGVAAGATMPYYVADS